MWNSTKDTQSVNSNEITYSQPKHSNCAGHSCDTKFTQEQQEWADTVQYKYMHHVATHKTVRLLKTHPVL